MIIVNLYKISELFKPKRKYTGHFSRIEIAYIKINIDTF